MSKANLAVSTRALIQETKTLQVFVGDTGETAGTIMTSFGSSDAAEVGRMMDARSEKWVSKIISKIEGKREMIHGFSLMCETYYAAEM